MLLAVLVRILLIVLTPGVWYDLRIYHHFGGMVLRGENPYLSIEGGAVRPSYADMPSLDFAVFAAVLALFDSPVTLRLFFVLIDALVIVVALSLRRTPLSARVGFATFYALHPFVLMSWTVACQDKCIVLLLLLLVFFFMERRSAIGSVVAAAVLAAYKWMAVVFVLPLVMALGERWRSRLGYLALFGLLFGVSHLAYYPECLLAYTHRYSRFLTDPPIHASLMMFLSELGLYDPVVPKLWIEVSIPVVYLLFMLRRLQLREAIVLSIFCAYIVGPEISFSRLLMLALPFFFIVLPSRRQIAAIWVVGLVAAVVLYANIRGLPGFLLELPLGPELARLLGREGSLNHVFFMNLLPVTMLGLFVHQRLGLGRRGAGSGPPSDPQGRTRSRA